MKKILLIGVPLIVISGFFVLKVVLSPKPSPYVMAQVSRGTLVERVLATGAIKKSESISLSFQAGGRIDSIAIKVGDHVKENQELSRIDTSALSAQLRQAQSSLEGAEADLAKAIAGSSSAEIAVAQSAVDDAGVSVTNEQNTLSNAQHTADEQLNNVYDATKDVFQTVRLKSNSAIQSLNNNFFDSTYNYKFFKNLGDSAFVSNSAKAKAEAQKALADVALGDINSGVDAIDSSTSHSVMDQEIISLQNDLQAIRFVLNYTYDALKSDANKTTVQTSWTDINTVAAQLNSQQQIIISTKNTNSTSLVSAQAAVDSAQAKLATAQAQLELKKTPLREVDLAPLRAKVSQARANVDSAQTNLNNAVLKSPVSGIITDILVKKGEIVVSAAPAITLIAEEPFTVESSIPEADIAKISIGNPLDITLDAVQNVKWTGKVIAIDPAQQIVGGVVTYKITTSLDNPDERVKPGMTANLDIETHRVNDALFVPQRAVLEKDQRKYVRVLNGNNVENIEVVAGIRSADGFVEIKSGLEEGKEIISFMKEK